MNLRNKNTLLNKFLSILFALIVAALNANAAENSVSGISVNQNTNGQYNILLKLDKAASVKKAFDGESLILTIPAAVPADSMEIAYDNAADLQNVTVQKKNADNTMIVFQGKNIENAQIFTKDISTGITKKLDGSSGILSNLLFIADKKLLGILSSAILLLLTAMYLSKPQSRKQEEKQTLHTVVKQHTKQMTLRRKNMIQSGNIPSINYGINGSFNSARMSMPNDFEVNNPEVEEEIRKAG